MIIHHELRFWFAQDHEQIWFRPEQQLPTWASEMIEDQRMMHSVAWNPLWFPLFDGLPKRRVSHVEYYLHRRSIGKTRSWRQCCESSAIICEAWEDEQVDYDREGSAWFFLECWRSHVITILLKSRAFNCTWFIDGNFTPVLTSFFPRKRDLTAIVSFFPHESDIPHDWLPTLNLKDEWKASRQKQHLITVTETK
jgi:hypothetical protein